MTAAPALLANGFLRRRAGRLWPWWLGWVLFVVYGSLVPLDFQPLPLDLAWQRLLSAPMFNLGIESRADWVANGVLYLPVGFLSAGALMGDGVGPGRKIASGLLGLLFGITLAIAVEFAQTAFPPRTVSRNDMLAESIGSALGVCGAWAGAPRFRQLLRGYGQGGQVLALRLAKFYALMFPAIVLFPFDLLVSVDEWQAKLWGPQVGLWLAGSSHHLGTTTLAAKLAVETLAVVPLGALWAGLRQPKFPGSGRAQEEALLLGGLLVGALLGLLVEGAQLAMASGLSQGVSVLTRACGFALGAAAWGHRSAWEHETLRSRVRYFSVPILVLMLMVLIFYNRAWTGPWLDLGQAWRRLAVDTRFLPFYYHYYVTEMQAVISLTAVSLCYAPLGLLGWAWHVRPGVVATMALLLSGLMELSKVFAQSVHSDPSNLWIAAAAVWLVQHLVQRLFTLPDPGKAGQRDAQVRQ